MRCGDHLDLGFGLKNPDQRVDHARFDQRLVALDINNVREPLHLRRDLGDPIGATRMVR